MLRFAVAGLVMALLVQGVAHAADPPPADPILTEAVEFPGYVDVRRIRCAGHGAGGRTRTPRAWCSATARPSAATAAQPDGTSLFRLNSIAKVFATEVLASLAARAGSA